MSNMVFLESAFSSIRDTVGSRKSETGGILLGNRDDYVVQKFVFDTYGSFSSGAYDPNVDFINATIKKEWEENNLALLGFIHSHPRGVSRLSGDWGNNTGDIGYMKAIFKAIPALEKFLVPIVYSDYDGQDFKLFPYIGSRGNEENYSKANLRVIPDEAYSLGEEDKKPPLTQTKVKGTWRTPFVTTHNTKSNSVFSQKTGLKDSSRLTGAIDIQMMSEAHVLGVGVGGATGLYENLVRSGLGNLTVIDFDTVDESNVTTQGYNLDEVGKLKVKVLGDRLKRINPAIKYNGINGDFLKFSEKELSRLCKKADLLMLMTDNFKAQARGNRAALKYQLPAIFAMMYRNARGSEVMFTIPDVTPACFRCAVSPRYEAYLNEGYENDVRSTGSTIFHTYYLSSVIGMVTLAMLHNDTEGYEFSNWFGEKWERNFLQIRNHPEYSSGNKELFHRTLGGSKRVFNFDSVWQKIEAEAPPKYTCCPDCNGTGNLRDSSKTIKKTNIQEAEIEKVINNSKN